MTRRRRLVGRRRSSGRRARPQHGDRVGDGEHLVEEVRDVDDRHASRAQTVARRRAGAADSSVVSAAVGSSMTISRGVAGERAQDLDLLLIGDAQRCRPAPRTAAMNPARRLSSSNGARIGADVDEPGVLGSIAEEDVVEDRSLRARARAPAR